MEELALPLPLELPSSRRSFRPRLHKKPRPAARREECQSTLARQFNRLLDSLSYFSKRVGQLKLANMLSHSLERADFFVLAPVLKPYIR